MCRPPKWSALERAVEDLQEVETTGIVGSCNGWWFHPVRKHVLVPVVGKIQKDVPPVAKQIPGGELVVCGPLNLVCKVAKDLHHLVSTVEHVLVSAIVETAPKFEQKSNQSDKEKADEQKEKEERKKLYEPLRETPFFSFAKLLQWRVAIQQFVDFLKENGIYNEMQSLDEEELLSNAAILGRLQKT